MLLDRTVHSTFRLRFGPGVIIPVMAMVSKSSKQVYCVVSAMTSTGSGQTAHRDRDMARDFPRARASLSGGY
jgi:hypothetical protein